MGRATAAKGGAVLLCLGLTLGGGAARARDFCPDRPGVGTTPCTIEKGRVAVELSLADRTWDRQPDTVIDTVVAGDLALRAGVSDHLELRFAWTPYGRSREEDRMTGEVERTRGIGDVMLGFKRNLIDPDGGALSVALLGSVSLPTGGGAVGAGDWGASLSLPFSMPIGPGLSLGITPEIDAAVDADRHGRHAAYGAMGGVTVEATDALGLTFELGAMRNEEPEETVTELLASLSAGLMLGEDTQIDVATEIALNRNVPDNRFYIGIARRF
ncbi:MAG TPA: transporter [Sphingobium sp.]